MYANVHYMGQCIAVCVHCTGPCIAVCVPITFALTDKPHLQSLGMINANTHAECVVNMQLLVTDSDSLFSPGTQIRQQFEAYDYSLFHLPTCLKCISCCTDGDTVGRDQKSSCSFQTEAGLKGWAICRVPWGEALLSLPPAKEQHDCTTGQVLSHGLSSKIGIFNGPIARLCPHAVTGQAYHNGPALPYVLVLPCACPPLCRLCTLSYWHQSATRLCILF